VLVDNKDNAVNQAKEIAKAAPLGQAIIHTRDGRSRPTTPTARTRPRPQAEPRPVR
jgi:hypothetical protein